MHKNRFIIVGTAVKKWEDKYAHFLLVHCDVGKGRDVVVRVWRNDLKEVLATVKNGETVEALGQCGSREGKTADRWFTEIEADTLAVVGVEDEGWPPRDRAKDAPAKSPADDTDIPF